MPILSATALALSARLLPGEQRSSRCPAIRSSRRNFALAPFSVEELAFDLKRKPYEVRLLVNALLREGSIVGLDTDRKGGPFYALPGYIEASGRRDHSDVILGRDYGGQYEAPIWRDEA
jgi:hypothetical protein